MKHSTESVSNSQTARREVSDFIIAETYSTFAQSEASDRYMDVMTTISACLEQSAAYDIDKRLSELERYRIIISEAIAALDEKIEALSIDTSQQHEKANQAKLQYATKIFEQDTNDGDDAVTDIDLEDCKKVSQQAIAKIMANDKEKVTYQAYRIGYDTYDQKLAAIETRLKEAITHIGAIALHMQALHDLGDVNAVPAPPVMAKPVYEAIDFATIDEELGLRPKDQPQHTYETLVEMPAYIPVTASQTEAVKASLPMLDLTTRPAPRLVAKINSPIKKILNQSEAAV